MLAFRLLSASVTAVLPQLTGDGASALSDLGLTPASLGDVSAEVSSALAAALQAAVAEPKSDVPQKQEHVKLLGSSSNFAEAVTLKPLSASQENTTASQLTVPSPETASIQSVSSPADVLPVAPTSAQPEAVPSQQTVLAAQDAASNVSAGAQAPDLLGQNATQLVGPVVSPTSLGGEQTAVVGQPEQPPSVSQPPPATKLDLVAEGQQAEAEVSAALKAAMLDDEEQQEAERGNKEDQQRLAAEQAQGGKLATLASKLEAREQVFYLHEDSGQSAASVPAPAAASTASAIPAAPTAASSTSPDTSSYLNVASDASSVAAAPTVSSSATPVVASPAAPSAAGDSTSQWRTASITTAANAANEILARSRATSAAAAAVAAAVPPVSQPAAAATADPPVSQPAAAAAATAVPPPVQVAARAVTLEASAPAPAVSPLSSKPPSPPPEQQQEQASSKSKNINDKKDGKDETKGGMGDAAWVDEAGDEEEEEEPVKADDEEGETKTDDELWAASTEDEAAEVQTDEDRQRWDATGLETKSGHVWMSDEETKDPDWGENMDQAEQDWAEALARESIEKQDDPLAFIDCRVNPLSPVKGNINDEWCIANCITKVSKEWPCPAEHCACTERPKRVFKAIEVLNTCEDLDTGCSLEKPYECLSGFLKFQCSTVPWKSKAYCASSCLRKAAPPLVRKADVKMGLPDCGWNIPRGCSQQKPYECTAGPKQGQCSASNWGKDETCEAYCLHIGGFNFAPTDKEWRPTPRTMDAVSKEGLREAFEKYLEGPPEVNITKPPHSVYPHYVHDDSQMEARLETFDGFRINYAEPCEMAGGTIVSNLVGISLYSPKYVSKSQRLLASCDQVGVCCLTAEVPSDAFGPKAPEGSPEFRFKFIAQKPLFMNYMTKRLNKPMVWLDVDMEFHQYPRLFTPNSWKDGPRDIVIFNFWGNETDTTAASTASGVIFMNNTLPAQALMQAWAESSAWPGNDMAPDDQVLDKLLNEGGWLHRCTFGWMHAAYMRHLPNYYRGVRPVIDHDRGNMDGLLGHSNKAPELPPWRCNASDSHFDAATAALEMKRVYTEPLATDKPWCDEFYNLTEGTITEVGPDSTKEDMARKKRYRRTCFAVAPPANDWWCTQHCNQGHCPESQCTCK